MKDVFDQALERLRATPARLVASLDDQRLVGSLEDFVNRGRAAQNAVDLAIGSGPQLAPVASISEPAPRTCEACGRRLGKKARPNKRTCSKRCRQRLSRKNAKASRKVSRAPAVARHILTDVARRRASPELHESATSPSTERPAQSRRAFVSGRLSGKGVRIA